MRRRRAGRGRPVERRPRSPLSQASRSRQGGARTGRRLLLALVIVPVLLLLAVIGLWALDTSRAEGEALRNVEVDFDVLAARRLPDLTLFEA